MIDEFNTDVSWDAPAPPESGPAPRLTLSKFVKDYSAQTERTLSARSQRIVDTFVSASRQLLAKFMEMAKQAIEYAISKFLVELCAMIIAAVSAALMKKHNKTVEISTGNVFYSPNGQQNNNGTQQSLWGSNNNRDDRGSSPFDSGWSRTGSGSW